MAEAFSTDVGKGCVRKSSQTLDVATGTLGFEFRRLGGRGNPKHPEIFRTSSLRRENPKTPAKRKILGRTVHVFSKGHQPRNI